MEGGLGGRESGAGSPRRPPPVSLAQVKVKRRGDDAKFLATVLAVGTECDIALLAVEGAAFWDGMAPLEFGPLPRLQDTVAVVGFPVGGSGLAVVAGVVSRIEVTNYVHGGCELLGVQVGRRGRGAARGSGGGPFSARADPAAPPPPPQTNASINSGNSGGPAVDRSGRCIGIAFQSMAGSDVENTGYIVPPPIIAHFLDDVARHGAYTGFPVLGIKWQRLESAPLRASLGMAAGAKGVLVRSVAPVAAAAAYLKPDDVITHFDGVEIAADGTVPFRRGERVAFSHLISLKFSGETATLRLLRAGEPMTVDVTLSRPEPLVPLHLAGDDPQYLVVAGLVFTPASEPYLQSEYGPDYVSDSPVKLLDAMLHGVKAEAGEQVVVLAQVLACDATLGYDDLFNVRLRTFNGARVRNLAHLAELVDRAAESGAPFFRFDLDYDEVVVLDAGAAVGATPDILAQHSIPADASPGLRAGGREGVHPGDT